MLADTVAMCRKALQPNNALLATAVLQLADMHRDLGNIDSARDLYHEALQYMRKSSESELAASIVKVGLALVAQENAQYNEALFMFNDAYNECEAAVGADHPMTVLCRMRHALCLLEAEKGNLSNILRKLPGPLIQLCGFDPKIDDFQSAAANIVQVPAATAPRLDHQFSDASECLLSDTGYAMLADSFERCTRTLGTLHPQTQCAHAWLQVVEAMNRQRPSDRNCLNRSPTCILTVATLCSFLFFIFYFVYSTIKYDNALELWKEDGASAVEMLPMSLVVNASAGVILHAVGHSFRFDGRVILCGNRPFSMQPLIFLSHKLVR